MKQDPRSTPERRRIASRRRDETLCRALIELAPDGIFIADLDGRYVDVNRAGCQMLGYRREELIGKTIHDLIPADRAEQLQHEKTQMLAGARLTSEWLLRRRDGDWLPVQVSASILPDGRWQGYVRDMSARKRLEAALQASLDDLQRAQSVAAVGSWRLDVRRDVLLWSEQEYRIFGVAPDTPMSYPAFLACVHPDDRDDVDRAWQAALTGQPYDIEHRILVDGGERWVREKADLEFDGDGTLIGGLGVTADISDRKQREEELRATRERLELALHGAELATWDWDLGTGTVIFNDRWAEMRGYRPDDVRGHVDTWTDGIHPDDRAGVMAKLQQHLRGRRPDYETEHRVRTRSGDWIWILDRGKVVARDADGEPLRMVGTELDITARKQAEQALQFAEAKASGILAISADALICVDAEQRITTFNDGAEKIFGYARDELLGAPLDTLIPERFRAAHHASVTAFATGRQVARRMGERGRTVFGRRRNGDEFPADAAISRLDVDGHSVLTVALRDTSEQVRSERQQRFLAESGALLATSLDLEATLARVAELTVRELADLSAVYLGDEHEIRRFRVLARDPAKQWIADALMQAPFEREQSRLVRDVLASGQSTLVATTSAQEIAAWSPDQGRTQALQALDPKSMLAVPLRGQHETLDVLALVSSSRHYDAADLQLVEDLARRAALSIENARLYEQAQHAIQAREDILGVVAHDLRNPLNNILLQAAVLALDGRTPTGARGTQPVDAIKRAAQHMHRLIQDLLDVSSIEAGRLSIERHPLDPAQLVAQAADSQRLLAASAALDLVTEVADGLPQVSGDAERLLQVFENLVGNAAKFSTPGGRITIGAQAGEHSVEFFVADTGAGITPEAMVHLFDRFWRARRTGRSPGLGLAIVKGIVEAHGGYVRVESRPGHGSRFCFMIPTASPEP